MNGRMARRKSPRKARTKDPRHAPEVDLLYGFHTAEAALRNPERDIRTIRHTKNAGDRLAGLLGEYAPLTTLVTPDALAAKLGRDAVHQGILVEASPLPDAELTAILDRAATPHGHGPLVVLDQVTDPHNVGAILRSAAAFGAVALVLTKRHSPPSGGVLAKAASGALEHVPIVRVTNLARALETIAQAGLQRIGLDAEAATAFECGPLEGPCALVLGAEDKGLRRLTREKCDFLGRLATPGAIASLNVSNAAAIALHACHRARSRAAKPSP
ncbi:MAG: 23S rRNA (guanosine(2251)-2'-O)-methyltransferase RlmB [Hyphomicrobiales bacterium]|nr:23S rRNA (guanosine(2251)-2'-O)-methyltransferase RlmB [Hyphomicrobiales bacterium]